MKWLQSEDPECPGRTRVDIYVDKQRRYTQAVENKTKAFDEALRKAQVDPCNKTIQQQREAYDRWVLENARTYRNYVQAAYMDWVITGKKEAVEYWFAVVDVDSALSRVETSKASQLEVEYDEVSHISTLSTGVHARIHRDGHRWLF